MCWAFITILKVDGGYMLQSSMDQFVINSRKTGRFTRTGLSAIVGGRYEDYGLAAAGYSDVCAAGQE